MSPTVKTLRTYTACDVSDALVRLGISGGGFIDNLSLLCAPSASSSSSPVEPRVTVAPASTILFAARQHPNRDTADVAKGTFVGSTTACNGTSAPAAATTSNTNTTPATPTPAASSSSPDVHWADLIEPGSFVILAQPDGQTNAVCGGILALRAKLLGAKGIAVVGRARDVDELKATGLPIWTRGVSTVGAAGATVPLATQVPITVGDTTVWPGDYIVSDPVNGLVAVPRELADRVFDMLPRLVSADDAFLRSVAGGTSVTDGLAAYRSKFLSTAGPSTRD